MVVIDGITWSCARCVSGHRATKCQHHDRELTEIKKKGRPIGCLTCSELRKTRSIHAKCVCIKDEGESGETKVAKKRKTLQDVLDAVTNPDFNSPTASTSQLPYIPSASSSSASASPFESLLNSCRCGKGGFCVECTITPLAKPRPVTATTTVKSQPCCPKPPPPIQSLSLSLPSFLSYQSSQLFIPSTLGTLSCFCGDSCSCPGCNTHDPAGRKFSTSSSSSYSIAASIPSNLEVAGNGYGKGKGKGSCEESKEEGGACKCSVGGVGRISTNDILVGAPSNGNSNPVSTILTGTSGIEVLITAATSSSSLLPPLPLLLPLPAYPESEQQQQMKKPNNLRTDLPSFEQLLKLVNQEDLLLQKRYSNLLPSLSPLPSSSSSSSYFSNSLPSLASLPSSLSYLLSPPSKLISLPPQASSSSVTSSSSRNQISNNLDFGLSLMGENLLLKNPVCSVLDPELEFDGGCIGGECLCSSGGCGCKD